MQFEEWFSKSGEMELFKVCFERGWNAALEHAAELQDLRSSRHEDKKVVNHFGEHVWLKACIVDGKRLGVTDCCFVDSPCERHAAMDV